MVITLRTFQLRVAYTTAPVEDIEFTAHTLVDAACAIARRRRADGLLVTTVTGGDGRSVNLDEKGEIHGTDFEAGPA